MAATVRIVPQEEIGKGTADVPVLRLAGGGAFAARAARLRQLAAREAAASGYLELMAALADAQHAALASHPKSKEPLSAQLEQRRSHGMPPLGGRDRASAWREVLDAIGQRIAPRLPETAAALLRGLSTASHGFVENLADRILDFDYPGLDARVVPFVGAALQVHWLHRAAMLGEAAFPRLEVANVCPVCGSPPVAAALHVDVPTPGSRYLHCALCASSWHVPRGQCTQCETRGKLAYFHIEGGAETVKAEACEECRAYLKIVNRQRDPLADPVADDLATLALDVLMDESGYQRAAPNLFFVPGQT